MVTRAEFVHAIRKFKRKHGGKLKEFLNTESNPETVKAFWSDPVIQAYLARPYVTFVDKHPKLHDSRTKEEHDVSDHYELKIYRYLPNEVAYRNNNIIRPEFYDSNTRNGRKLFSELLCALGTDDIEVMPPCKLNVIADKVNERFLTAQSAASTRFLISTNWQDGHASTCITIFDPETRHQLITLFMNSFRNKNFYQNIKEQFLQPQTRYFKEEKDGIEHLKNDLIRTFSIDVGSLSTMPTSFLVNQEEKAAFIINCPDEPDDETIEARKAIVDSSEIETTYCFNMLQNDRGQPSPLFSMTGVRNTPFIGASHRLQKDNDDKNCALYSLNFIQAIVEMLKQPEMADRVFKLARTVKSDPGAIKTLVQIFQEDLKAYLPCYYDIATGMPKSSKELETFHVSQRWEIGRKSLFIFHPVEQSALELEKDTKQLLNEEAAQNLINNKLRPLTENYLSYLKKLPEQAETNVNNKIQKIENLLDVLSINPHSNVRRVNDFYKQLNEWEDVIKAHRDPAWKRYIRNAVIAVGALVSGLGLVALAVYAKKDDTGTKSMKFWKSRGENVVDSLKEEEPQSKPK